MIHDEAGAVDLVYLVFFWFKVRSAPPGMLSPFFSVRWKEEEEEEEDGLRIVTEGGGQDLCTYGNCVGACVFMLLDTLWKVLSQYISCNSLPLELFLRCIQPLNLKAKVTKTPPLPPLIFFCQKLQFLSELQKRQTAAVSPSKNSEQMTQLLRKDVTVAQMRRRTLFL